MESPVTSQVGPPVRGYARADVDDFIAAAEVEAARFESVIEDADARTRRARASIGTHRVMVAMLLQTQRELDEIRASAESEAAAILAQAERDADAIVSAEHEHQVVDLTDPDSATEKSARMNGLRPSQSQPKNSRLAIADRPDLANDEGSEYFDFLRGALVDQEPLGPRAE